LKNKKKKGLYNNESEIHQIINKNAEVLRKYRKNIQKFQNVMKKKS